MSGQRLGPWRLLSPLGRGGMGVVWLAEDRAGRRAAVKVLEGSPEALGVGLRRFAQELEALRRLDHPRVVRPLSGLEREGQRHWFAMQLVRGRNLAQLIESQGPLSPADALAVAADAAEGLEAAHAAGVLHRDVKSHNVLVDEQGRAVLVDFGLARAMDQTRLTLSGQAPGTPAYASPEQARGQASRVESDLYSLGVVLYEALTGTLPFSAETPLALLRLHTDEPPDPPSTRRPDLPPALDALVLRALAKDPRQRFASAAALREALLAARAGLGTPPEATPGAAALGGVVRAALAAAPAPPAPARPRRSLPLLLVPLAVLVVVPLAPGRLPQAPPPAALPAAAVGDGGSSAVVAAEPAGVQVEVVLRAGGSARGRLVAIAAGQVRLATADGQERSIPLGEVERLRYDR